MKPVTGKRLCRLLEAKGWELKRINGSLVGYAVRTFRHSMVRTAYHTQLRNTGL